MPRLFAALVALVFLARGAAAQDSASVAAPCPHLPAGADSLPACARGAATQHTVRPRAEERAAIRDFYDLLAGRAPGVYVRRGGGEVGAAAQLTLRGASHLFAPDAPMVVVDGIRIAAEPAAVPALGPTPSVAVLADLDPEEIESVRVLPGPAAAARYGPAGSAGAIEVTTRRGARTGMHAAGFAQLGVAEDAGAYPLNYERPGTAPNGSRTRCPLSFQAQGACQPRGDSLYSWSPLLQARRMRGGTVRNAGARVHGGSGPVSWLAYAARGVENGVLRENGARRTDLHGRLALRLPHALELSASASHLQRDLDLPETGTFAGTVLSGLLGTARDDSLHGYRRPESTLTTNLGVRRSFAAVSAAWSGVPWARLEARVGIDRADRDGLQRRVLATSTALDSTRAYTELRTAALEASLHLTPAAGLAWRARAGAERSAERTGDREAFHYQFNGIPNAGSSLQELWARRRVVGVWLNQGLEWRGTVTLDGLLRRDLVRHADGLWSGSAGLSWALSDERFFPRVSWVDGVRLRAAWGMIESQQGAWIGLDPHPFFSTAFCGQFNPCDPVRPERNSELEAGLDARLLGHASLALTGYRRTTARLQALTSGFSGVLVENAGAVTNTGVEGSLRLGEIVTGPARWELELLGAANRNRVSGFARPLPAPGNQMVANGYPLGGYWVRPLLSYDDRNGDGLIAPNEVVVGDSAVFLGPTQPTRMLAAAARVRLGPATVRARLEHQGGNLLLDQAQVLRCGLYFNCAAQNDPSTPLAEQAAAVGAAIGAYGPMTGDASFTRLREVTLTLAAPARLARSLGGAQVDLTLAGRNLATFTSYSGLDPEVNTSAPGLVAVGLGSLALPRSWSARMDVHF